MSWYFTFSIYLCLWWSVEFPCNKRMVTNQAASGIQIDLLALFLVMQLALGLILWLFSCKVEWIYGELVTGVDSVALTHPSSQVWCELCFDFTYAFVLLLGLYPVRSGTSDFSTAAGCSPSSPPSTSLQCPRESPSAVAAVLSMSVSRIRLKGLFSSFLGFFLLMQLVLDVCYQVPHEVFVKMP